MNSKLQKYSFRVVVLYFIGVNLEQNTYEPAHDKTNKMAYAPILVRVFAVRSVGS